MMVECKNACAGHVFPLHLSSTYSRIAYAGAGGVGVAVTDFSIIVTLLGVCIAYQITFAQLLQEVPWTNFSTSTLTILSGLLALPLCCVPNIGVLGIFSLIGLVCLITSVVAIIVYGVLLYGDAVLESPFGASAAGGADDHLTGIGSDAHAHLPLWPETLSSMTSFIGVATFCFGLCSLAFPVEESMRDKRQFATAVAWSLVFVWFVYVLLGDVGAILYVHSAVGIKDNILSNLPTDSFVALLVRLAMTGVSGSCTGSAAECVSGDV
jgi:amino acid permease